MNTQRLLLMDLLNVSSTVKPVITRDLIVTNSGHADEFRLGELVTLTLEFNQLDDNFDYRLNKCWTLDSNNDGNIFFRFLLRINIQF